MSLSISGMPPSKISNLTLTQLNSLSASQFSTMTSSQLDALTTTQVAGLDSINIAALSPGQAASLTTTQVAYGLTNAQLVSMSAAAFQALTPSQTAALTTASPTAIAALCGWLDTVDAGTANRGRAYFRANKVGRPRSAGPEVLAEVRGTYIYTTVLRWKDGSWTSTCTCPLETDCKHAVATGLAWVRQFDRNSAVLAPRSSPLTSLPRGVTTAAALLTAQGKKKLSFREEWAPKLAAKLGRPLTPDESHLLGQLSALFHAYHGHPGWLYSGTLEQHGFPVSTEAINSNGMVFADWFDPARPPADPWALWQYIAFDWERTGRDLPEAFRPMTDTAALAARIEEKLIARELEQWRRCLSDDATARNYPDAFQRSDFDPPAGLCLQLMATGEFFLELQPKPGKPWKRPTNKWLSSLSSAGPAEFAGLPAPAAALAATYAAHLRTERFSVPNRDRPPEAALTRILAYAPACEAVFLPDGTPWRVESAPLAILATLNPARPKHLDLRLVAPDGREAQTARLLFLRPTPHYLFDGRVYPGPPMIPSAHLPMAALLHPGMPQRFREIGIQLPSSLEVKLRRVAARPRLRCWTDGPAPGGYENFHAQLFASTSDPPTLQEWRGLGGWQWVEACAPPPAKPDEPFLEFDLRTANEVGAKFGEFRLQWNTWSATWSRPVGRDFPEAFLAWRASLPPDLDIEAKGELAGLAGPPLRAHLEFSAMPIPGEHGRDWFDLTVALRVEDTTLTPDEIALLLKARGKWVQLPQRGWRRLELADSPETRATLDRLGLDAGELDTTGKPVVHRLHALQLAGEATALESRDARLADALRERIGALASLPPPTLPAGLCAELRPYQREGFHFLAHLAANGLGGVLADDMGLGKTVQTLAWLLHLAAEVRHPNLSADPAVTLTGNSASVTLDAQSVTTFVSNP